MSRKIKTDPSTLDRLPVGQPAFVARVDGGHDEVERLKVMGLCEGAPVHNLRVGNRMVTCVAGTRLGMTAEIARFVQIRTPALANEL